MIRPLRQRHRRIVIALGLTLPIVFTTGILARRPVPSASLAPAESGSSTGGPGTIIWEQSDIFPKSGTQVRLLRQGGSAGGLTLRLSPPKDFVKPDLIVYWIAGNSKTTETLAENAVLLGAFNSTALALPGNASTESGVLVLYSLANNEIVDVSKPLRFSNSTH